MHRSLLLVLSAFALILAAGLGCAAGGRAAGEACTQTADCNAELACVAGRCSPPSGCPAEAPIDCGATLPDACCPRELPICCAKDRSCYATAAECAQPSACSGDGKLCRTSATCCAGLSCGRFSTACVVAKNLGLGEPCTENSQCRSAFCEKYCTDFCTKTAECGAANYCLEDEIELTICVPFCRTNADCSVFGADVICRDAKDPDGLMLKGCFARQ